MSELLTSLDIVNQSFKKSLRGYDPTEVDEFLDHVAETLQNYNARNKELERELTAKEESLAEYDRMKDVLHEALLMAQKSADERVKSARAQADKILSDAKAQADDICREAAAEAERLRVGVQQIRNIRDLYAQEFRGILAKFDTQLNQALNSSLGGAVESVLEGLETPPAKESAAEESDEVELKADKKDFEAACGILGVDPRDILGAK
ncbi:MAG: DivIVA domain-containing protein [Synergistaceae bacterium]|nr:DivIVA domain-containing protein [Synergistaceae bacterium]